jgi:hypothetical protein
MPKLNTSLAGLRMLSVSSCSRQTSNQAGTELKRQRPGTYLHSQWECALP